MKQYVPRVGTPAPYASHHLFIGSSVKEAFKSAMGDYLELAQDFFISGAVISSTPSGSGALYSITAGHLMYKGELMEVDAHSVLKSASQIIYIGVQDDGLDAAPVLNTDGNTDYVMRRRHARLRVASVYPTEYMVVSAPRKTDLDRLRNKGRLVPKNGILPYSGSMADFDATGLGVNDMEGFAVCNGLNGTPDLRGMALFGATNVPDTGAPVPYSGLTGSTNVGDRVGADQVQIGADNLPPHKHAIDWPTADYRSANTSGDASFNSGSNHAIHTFPPETEENTTPNNPIDVRQPSHAVVWLMSIA